MTVRVASKLDLFGTFLVQSSEIFDSQRHLHSKCRMLSLSSSPSIVSGCGRFAKAKGMLVVLLRLLTVPVVAELHLRVWHGSALCSPFHLISSTQKQRLGEPTSNSVRELREPQEIVSHGRRPNHYKWYLVACRHVSLHSPAWTTQRSFLRPHSNSPTCGVKSANTQWATLQQVNSRTLLSSPTIQSIPPKPYHRTGFIVLCGTPVPHQPFWKWSH